MGYFDFKTENMKRFIETATTFHPLYKRVSIIFLAMLLVFASHYITSFAAVYILFLLVGIVVGYLSKGKNDVLINGALFGYFFHITIIALNGAITFDSKILIGIILLPLISVIPGIICTTLGYLIKEKIIRWLLLINIPIVVMMTWFNFYHQLKYTEILSILILLSGLIFCFKTKLKIWKVCFIVTVAGVAAHILEIIADWHQDPTSHNLLPFEIVIYSLTFFAFSLASCAIGLIIKLLISKKREEIS